MFLDGVDEAGDWATEGQVTGVYGGRFHSGFSGINMSQGYVSINMSQGYVRGLKIEFCPDKQLVMVRRVVECD